MLLYFDDEKSKKWAMESLNLYRKLRWMEFKEEAKFPDFTQLPQDLKDTMCKTHNHLMYRLGNWLTALRTGSYIEFTRGDAVTLVALLNYRPWPIINPNNYVGEQIELLKDFI